MVVEIPAAGDASIVGTLVDAWKVPLADVGLAGEDHGKGGKYLLLPPGYQGNVPDGTIGLPMKTYNGLVGLRVITRRRGISL
jgi:hypothetical protein